MWSLITGLVCQAPPAPASPQTLIFLVSAMRASIGTLLRTSKKQMGKFSLKYKIIYKLGCLGYYFYVIKETPSLVYTPIHPVR